MNPNTEKIAEHLREFGLVMLGRALKGCCVKTDHYTPPYEGQEDFSDPIVAVQAAHGAELVIKARIAEQHPLLIFSTLPPLKSSDTTLTLDTLFDKGRSYTYSELPDILWATSGYKVSELKLFKEFGYLRNQIIHLGVPPGVNIRKTSLIYILKVIEPMVHEFWQESIVSFAERWVWDIVCGGFLQYSLINLDIPSGPYLHGLLGEESEAGYKELCNREEEERIEQAQDEFDE